MPNSKAKTKVKTIGIRELSRDLKTVTWQAINGQSFVVMKNSEPVFRIEPVEEKQAKLYTLKDIKKLQFHSGEGDLSQNIDKILYGSNL